jgi:hypothetical protein
MNPWRRRHALAALCAIVLACLLGGVDAAEPKLGRADWAAIKRVISQQLNALRAGDGERAFSYASPGIRAQFGDAQRFLTMVRNSYSPLLDARYTEFLEGAVIEGVIVQPVRLIAPDNTVLVALYTIEKHQGAWRINGCQLAPSTVKAA